MVLNSFQNFQNSKVQIYSISLVKSLVKSVLDVFRLKRVCGHTIAKIIDGYRLDIGFSSAGPEEVKPKELTHDRSTSFIFC